MADNKWSIHPEVLNGPFLRDAEEPVTTENFHMLMYKKGLSEDAMASKDLKKIGETGGGLRKSMVNEYVLTSEPTEANGYYRSAFKWDPGTDNCFQHASQCGFSKGVIPAGLGNFPAKEYFRIQGTPEGMKLAVQQHDTLESFELIEEFSDGSGFIGRQIFKIPIQGKKGSILCQRVYEPEPGIFAKGTCTISHPEEANLLKGLNQANPDKARLIIKGFCQVIDTNAKRWWWSSCFEDIKVPGCLECCLGGKKGSDTKLFKTIDDGMIKGCRLEREYFDNKASPQLEKPKAEEKPVEKPKAEEKPVEEPKAEEKPVEEPKAEEKPEYSTKISATD